MHKIGDEIDGYCPRCRLNTYQIISATDGRTVFHVTCRTCRNPFPWRPELSMADQRQKAMKKLHKLQRARLGGPPEVLSRGRKQAGDLDAPLKALEALHGAAVADEVREKLQVTSPMPQPPSLKPAPAATSGAVPVAAGPPAVSVTARWTALTAKLGWRDGKPYQATRTYKAGDVVLHKEHGLGVVQQVVHETACVVLFRDRETVLEMALNPAAVDSGRMGGTVLRR
jgi:hypothetical protein